MLPKFAVRACAIVSFGVIGACTSGGGGGGGGGEEQGGASGSGGAADGQGGDTGTGGNGTQGGGGGGGGGNASGGNTAMGGATQNMGGNNAAGGARNMGGNTMGGAPGTGGMNMGGMNMGGSGGSNFGINESDPKAKNWVFLMCGQSNMSGTSPIEAEDRIAAPRVFKLARGKTWAPGTEGFNINPWSSVTGAPSALGDLSLSPSRTFAIELLKTITDPNVNIYVVNAAMSGSNIESWEPGVGVNYTTMIPFLDEGLKMGLLRGFIWHQGEANSGTADTVYAMKLKAIIQAIRTKVGNPLMPAVAGEIGTTSDNGGVNRALAMIAASDPRFDFATSENLTLNDNVHYSSASAREFGRRYAAVLWRIVNK